MADIRERLPLREQVAEEDIDYDEVPRSILNVSIITPSFKDLKEYCLEHGLSQADFIEHAIQRELDYRNGDLRYVIKHVMAKIFKED